MSLKAGGRTTESYHWALKGLVPIEGLVQQRHCLTQLQQSLIFNMIA